MMKNELSSRREFLRLAGAGAAAVGAGLAGGLGPLELAARIAAGNREAAGAARDGAGMARTQAEGPAADYSL